MEITYYTLTYCKASYDRDGFAGYEKETFAKTFDKKTCEEVAAKHGITLTELKPYTNEDHGFIIETHRFVANAFINDKAIADKLKELREVK